MRRTRYLLIALIIVSCIGCAQNASVKAWKAGEISKVSAETAYQGMYLAYREGRISAEDMHRADEAYLTWKNSQSAYIHIIRSGSDDSGVATRQVQEALMALLQLAAAFGVL